MAEPFCFQMSIAKFVEENFSNIRAPFLAGVELTAKCNMKCVHCYAKNGIYDEDMSTENVFKIIDILAEHGTLGIYFTGGEVLTRSDFDDIYIYAKEKGMSVSILSNITLLSKKHIELFKEYPVSEVSTTLYGVTEDVYESVTGIKGSHSNFMFALNLLKENNIPVSLKYVVVKENLSEVHLAQKFAEQHKCRIMTTFSIHTASDGDIFPLEHRVSSKDAFDFDINDVKRREFWEQKATDLKFVTEGKKKPHTYCRRDGGYLYPCDISWHSVFISHTGMMQACTKASYKCYDLLNGNFEEGWEYLKTAFRDQKSKYPYECLNCDKFHYCEQCTANYLSENIHHPKIDRFFCEVATLRKDFVERMAK